ncbi:MAG: T9SS type A sorting domain-containing protein [Ignavibacteriae bacterium]|nr:T9SS type A sorting domain-containing protein [Ignavibacteriota bacterium]
MKQVFTKLILGISFLASVNLIEAQPNYPAPTGVWCSCPPTTGIGNGSVDPTVASKPYVNGILVRVAWKDIETSDNSYNWALIDNQITLAETYGKKISLAIGGGPNSPGWLYSLGTQSISYTIPFSGTIPIPWDTTFLAKWTEFVTVLGNRYAKNTTIQLVYITNSSGNGFEMQLPFNPTPSYSTIAYTDQKIIDSWKKVIDIFNNSFPNHYLTNDFHPVNSSNIVADSIYAYAKLHIGSRYGANGWWWTQNNTGLYSSQYAILQNSATNNQFTGIQMAYSGTTSGSSFGTGGMPVALKLAISNHICYWEIWNNDITSGTFDTLLSNAVCSPLGAEEITIIESGITITPNPSQDIFTITLKNNSIEEIEVINELGQIIFRKDNIKNNQYPLDFRGGINGIYFLKVTDNKKEISYRKIILKK